MSDKENDVYVLASMAPDNPDEREEWANEMARMQVALWVGDERGARCAHCKKQYKSVDDFIARNPKRGFGKGWDNFFVDSACWDEYSKERQK